MRSLLALVVAAGAFGAPLPASAADAPPMKPLRELVYDISYSAHTSHEKKTSGFNGAYGNPGEGVGVSSGSGTAAVGLNGTDHGRLVIDVVAATADGGLVIDASYTGALAPLPRTRIALFPDGRLSADPTVTISPGVVLILPLLARGFIADRDVSPGSSWTVAAPPPAKGSTTYRVRQLDGQLATIALEGTMSVAGVAGFDETNQGTTRYATNLVSPVVYDVNTRIHRQLGVDESTTTDTHFTATLVSDTFAKK